MDMQENILSSEHIRRNWEAVKAKALDSAIISGRNPEDISIVAVAKTHPSVLIKNAIEAGIGNIGENYVQEMVQKYNELTELGIKVPKWHFIGHLQTNKVKNIIPFVDMIHSVDSAHLAGEISKQAEKLGRTIDILLQVNTSGEESKSGCEPKDIHKLTEEVVKFANIKICGLMTIGTFSDDEKIIKREFRQLRTLRDELALEYPEIDFHHLSMGMTNDYPIAIAEGATLVRIGTAIFGERYYLQN
jgi:PLP dependent protein